MHTQLHEMLQSVAWILGFWETTKPEKKNKDASGAARSDI